MPSPFPGMDPWLERPALWPDVHDSLIMSLRRTLTPLLRPRYYVAVQQRTVMAVLPPEPGPMIPDLAVVETFAPFQNTAEPWAAVLDEPVVVDLPAPVMIREDYLEVVEVADNRVVTVIEILSPSNKCAGKDRKKYAAKRNRIFQTDISLVEIDLLRDGEPMPFTFLQNNGHLNHYRILVKRGERGRRAFLYPFNLRDPIPVVPLPLQPGDVEPPIRLSEVFKQTYEACGYDMRLNYHEPPEPPLSEDDMLWSKEILRAHKAVNS